MAIGLRLSVPILGGIATTARSSFRLKSVRNPRKAVKVPYIPRNPMNNDTSSSQPEQVKNLCHPRPNRSKNLCKSVKSVGKQKSLRNLSKSEALNKRRRLPTLPHCIAVPSAQVSLTSLFGMGRGGTSPQ